MFRYLCATLVALFTAVPAQAQDTAPLSLDAAARLAQTAQPLLEAQTAAVNAARESAVAAGQLPDPVLSGGLSNLTLTGSDRFTLEKEGDTQVLVGIKQQFLGGNKRELRGARAAREADRLEAELEEQRRMIARETALAWLETWKALRAQELVQASIAQAQLQAQAAEIAFSANRASQAEVLTARVSLELLNDQLANLQQMEWHGRNQLRRWIGADAERPLEMTLPAWPAPDTEQLAAHLQNHPHVRALTAAAETAEAALELARADYKPDFSVMAGYGYRPAFADYASLTFEIGLPFFTANRQDRGVAAAASQLEQMRQMREDWLKQHRADIALNVADWRRLRERFARYDTAILPQAQQRLDSTLAAYGAGGSTLALVLDARRSLLDVRMQRLELELDAAMHQVKLAYFAGQDAQVSQQRQDVAPAATNHEAAAAAGDSR